MFVYSFYIFIILGGAIERKVFLRYRFGGLIFGGAYTWRGLLSEFTVLSMLGTGYILKIAKVNSQREKPMCPSRKN